MQTSARPLLRRPVTWVVLGVVAVALIVGLYLFQPWKLFVNETVDEAAPTAASAGASASPGAAAPAATAPAVLATGKLISHEHTTTGTVRILGLPDGTRVLRVEDLRTSNGPDVHVWLTDAAVLPGTDGWGVFDDGRYVDLGTLKGNLGSSNYVLPAGLNLGDYRSVSLWCDRFNVSFGAAALTPGTG